MAFGSCINFCALVELTILVMVLIMLLEDFFFFFCFSAVTEDTAETDGGNEC